MAMNALGLLYPASREAAVHFFSGGKQLQSRRSCCRHLPKFILVSSRNTRSIVLLLAPQSSPSFSSVLWSAGSASKVPRMRQLEWDGLNGPQLIDNDSDNASLLRSSLLQFLKLACMQNQLP